MAETPVKKRVKNYEQLRMKDKEPVKGLFHFYELPGGRLQFSFKAYDGDQVEPYDLIDGQVYTLPLGVARHLNKNGWYPQYEHIKGEQDTAIGFGPNTTMRIARKIRRFGFQSLEFIDIDDLNETGSTGIVEVEAV